jgi:MOSC domain-containing protein YiiM
VPPPPPRDQNLRGIYWKVLEPGAVAVGDAIQVVSKPGLA